MSSFKPSAFSFTHVLAAMMLCLSMPTNAYTNPGPDPLSSGKNKQQHTAVGANARTTPKTLSQLHPKTMLPTGLPRNGQPLRSTGSELPMLHPRTLLPTSDTNADMLVSHRRSSFFRPWFRKQQRNSKQQAPFMTMGEVASNNSGSGKENQKPKWLERLQNISNIASLLCVLDCTILPAVTLLLPLLGVAASPAQMEWIHGIGHSVAMYFVLPVGGSAAAMNFVSHKKPLISLPALLGLALVYLANAHGGPILSRLPHDFVHSMHCGTALHRVSNIVGCALLLGSNYMSHRLGCAFSHSSSTQHGDGCGC